jgi:hypothetical protein
MFANSTIYAKHALLTTKIDDHTRQIELLSLRIFVDNSLVEVYANNRTVIATHIYPTFSDSTGLGYIVGEQGGSVTFSNVSIWLNLQNAFSKRPTNSSIDLVNNITSGATFSSSIHSLFYFFLIFVSFVTCYTFSFFSA